MRPPRHHVLLRALVAAAVLLASLSTLAARPAAAALPAVHVHALGGLPAFPDLLASNKPAVGISATPSGLGYWLVAGDGGVFPYGDAGGYGSTGGIVLNRPIVDLEPTPSGQGYWLVASDGGLFPFGDAQGWGTLGGTRLNQPIVDLASTPTGNGFWMVGADGGIFPFGDAQGWGTLGGTRLNRPIVEMAATPTGDGFWMVAADGGIFPFGDAPGPGSVPGTGAVVSDVVGMARSATGNGYVVAARSGRVWSFGDAPSLGGVTVATGRAVVGVATAGIGYWLADAPLPPPPPPLFPPLPAGSGIGRRIVYCVTCQRVWLVEANGIPSRSYLVSGRYATPRAGSYSVYSKSRYAWAGHDGITMEYMVRFAYGRTLAIGFHTIPRYADGTPLQTEAQLGTYRSSGCVRQATRDAIALWNFAPIGTRVVVTP